MPVGRPPIPICLGEKEKKQLKSMVPVIELVTLLPTLFQDLH